MNRLARICLTCACAYCLLLVPGAASASDGAEKTVEERLRSAQYELTLANYAKAETIARAILEEDPKHLEAGILVATALAGMQKIADAVAFLEATAETHPDSPEPWRYIARIRAYFGRSGVVEAFEQVLARAPKDLEALRATSRRLYERWKSGETEVGTVLRARLRAFLAAASPHDHLYDDAQLWLTEVEDGPAAVELHQGQELFEAAWRDQYGYYDAMEKARGHFEACLETDPGKQMCHYYLGLVHASVKAGENYDPEKSRAHFEKATNVAGARKELGDLELEAGDAVAAETHYRAALELDDRLGAAWLGLGRALKFQQKNEPAKEAFVSVYELDPASSASAKAVRELSTLDPEHPVVVEHMERFGIRRDVGPVLNDEAWNKIAQVNIDALGGRVEDSETQAVLEAIGERIVRENDIAGDYDVRVLLVADGSINAQAMPSGHVLVTQGLIDFVRASFPDTPIDADNPYLAAVLAHEITHVVDQHGLESHAFAQAWARVTSDPELKTAYQTGNYGWLDNELQHTFAAAMTVNTRAQEIEADRGGILLLFQAGYPPAAALDFMAAMGKKMEIPPHLDHPTADERISYLREFWANDARYAWMAFEMGNAALDAARELEQDDVAASHEKYADAVEHYQRFLKLFPHNAETLNNLGVAYVELGFQKQTTPSVLHHYITPLSLEREQALAFQPAISRGAEELSHTALYDRGVEALQKALDVNPTLSSARVNLAAALLARDEPEAAAAVFAGAKQEHIETPGVYHNMRGIVLAEQGKLDEAASAFDEASEAGLRPTAQFNHGVALARGGKTQDAWEVFGAIVREHPDDPLAEEAATARAELETAEPEISSSCGCRIRTATDAGERGPRDRWPWLAASVLVGLFVARRQRRHGRSF